jgi:hypothetical protein
MLDIHTCDTTRDNFEMNISNLIDHPDTLICQRVYIQGLSFKGTATLTSRSTAHNGHKRMHMAELHQAVEFLQPRSVVSFNLWHRYVQVHQVLYIVHTPE